MQQSGRKIPFNEKGECAKSARLLFFLAKAGETVGQIFTRLYVLCYNSASVRDVDSRNTESGRTVRLLAKHRRPEKKIALLLVLALLTGCGSAGTQEVDSVNKEVGLETAPVLDYEVPDMLPGILLNRIGYEPSSLKLAVVRGSSLPESFRIVEEETGKVVYTGVLEDQGYDKTSGEYISYGDFTGFTEEGTYYMECDIVGRSYPFQVTEGLYGALLEGALESLGEQRQELTAEEVQDVCMGLSVLLLSYELYGPVYEEMTDSAGVPVLIVEIQQYVEWLLTLQDTETGAIVVGEEPQIGQTAWFSAVLAKFSYTYQKFDSIYATACLQAADRAWNFLADKEAPAELLFFAATELYRAAGQYQYRQAVTKLGYELEPDADSKALVLGTLTYASTKRRVDVDLCARLTAVLFEEAEQIAQSASTNVFMVGSTPQEDGLSGFLWDMVIVSAIDYIITNHEYAMLIEKYQNFLAGENPDAYCYLYNIAGEMISSENRTAEGIGESCEETAGYIMLLSEIMSHRQEEQP